MNPNVDVLVAMSFIGIAACSPIRGVWRHVKNASKNSAKTMYLD
jgi:hypothetical protein